MLKKNSKISSHSSPLAQKGAERAEEAGGCEMSIIPKIRGLASIFLLLCLIYGHSENKDACSATLFYSPYCPYCQQVIDYLHKIQRKVHLKDVKKVPGAKDELKRIGGVLEVPCLIIDNTAIYRADPIIQWISEHKEDLEPV